MQAVDIKGQLAKYFLDDSRKIPKAHQNSVCKLRQGSVTCRYVCLSTKGYVCVKHTPMRETLDQLVAQDKMSAKGNNCAGLGDSGFDSSKEKTQKEKDNRQEEKDKEENCQEEKDKEENCQEEKDKEEN